MAMFAGNWVDISLLTANNGSLAFMAATGEGGGTFFKNKYRLSTFLLTKLIYLLTRPLVCPQPQKSAFNIAICSMARPILSNCASEIIRKDLIL